MQLFHYCSNSSFLSIISAKEVWTSECSLSNDRMEGQWLREVFTQYCGDKSVSESVQRELLGHLDTLIAFAGGAGFCMSEEGDLLSQWRAYADNGAGVSIGFNRNYFETLGNLRRDRNERFAAHLTKIEYDISAQKRLIGEHIDEILQLVSDGALSRPTLLTPDDDKKKREKKFADMTLRFLFFFVYLYSMKNPAFAEEREWRLLTYLTKGAGDAELSQISQMEFRALQDRIIPYARIPLEPLTEESVDEVVIGPRNVTPDIVVKSLLLKHGWPKVKVRRSTASYR